jgi:hypothetical protein
MGDSDPTRVEAIAERLRLIEADRDREAESSPEPTIEERRAAIRARRE